MSVSAESALDPARPTIPQWFAGKNILITGATGFMGKVLVEKLLRECPLINRMYLLVRKKKGVEPVQRREEYINHLVFNKVRSADPEQMAKIRCIKGDVSLDNLDMDESDRIELTEQVDVIFHCAANVRFDQPLRDAVNMNTLGTQRLLQLAEKMLHLKVFTHVSTAYCQCKEDVLEERGYPALHSPLGIAKMTELLDAEILEYLTPKLLQGLPNTYAYTKALTEELVSSYDNKLPIIITRPSIVTAAWKEPMPGWVEGLNGPSGMMIGAARGVVRSMHCNPDMPADVIPVDTAINAIICATWDRGLKEDNVITYCNITLPQDKQLSWGQSIEMGKQLFDRNPLSYALWYPNGTMKNNYWHHWLCVVFFHYLPAYFIDGLCVLFRKKPFLVDIQKRISSGLKVLQYYTTRNWVFKNDNFLKLEYYMCPDDRVKFDFKIENIEFETYLSNYIMGLRHYSLKESEESLPAARALLRKLYLLDRFVSVLCWGFLAWLVYTYLGTILLGCETMFEVTRDILSQRRSSLSAGSG